MPVFWVDAEDHDWEEVASCTVLDAEFQPRTITLPPPEGAGELPVAALTLDDARRAKPRTSSPTRLRRTDFTEWVMTGLRAAYRPGVGMADAFARWLEALLGPHGLVVFDSADPAAKPLVADVFARELASPGRTAALAAAAGEALAARGHEPQVVPQPDSASLFHLDGARRPIRRHGDPFAHRRPAVPGRRARGGELASAPGALQPERAAPADRAGHALPDHLLRRRAERAGLPRTAARRLPAVRRADAAHVSARHGDARRFRDRAVPVASTTCRSRICSRRTNRR